MAYTEGPSNVALSPLDVRDTEHVIAAEAENLVGTVKDGVRLMETETALSADLVEGMTHSSSTPVVPHANLGALDEHLHEDCPGECHQSTCPQRGALPTKPRCEEKLQAAGDVPPDPKGHGPTMSHTDNKDIIELVKLDQLQVPVLDVTSPGEFNLAVSAVLDIAVSRLRQNSVHPCSTQGKPAHFGRSLK